MNWFFPKKKQWLKEHENKLAHYEALKPPDKAGLVTTLAPPYPNGHRSEADLTPDWMGKHAIKLPISGDIVSTIAMLSIQVENSKVIVCLAKDHQCEIQCKDLQEADKVRRNIARFIGMVYEAPASGFYIS